MKAFVARYWKWILAIIIGLGTIVVLAQYRTHALSAEQITTAPVTRKSFIRTVTSSGKTQADTSVNLKFQTSGKLAWVGVKEGDIVRAGQAIAKLDSREVQDNLDKALRDYSKERNDFEETWRVTYDGKSVNDAFTDTVKRILQKNQWDLDKAVLDVELKSLSVEFATLISPISGIVTHIDMPVAGVNITPATAVFTIDDPNSLVFEANVDETDISSLSIGQPATITLDAYPDKTFSGKVSYISYASELSSGGATVFPIKVLFDHPETLRVGLNGDISIEVDHKKSALSIPIEALREDINKTYVYKPTKTGYTKTAVSTGERNDTSVIITKGLTEGDRVVTKGFSNIAK